jgi:hypothetical protein
LQIYWTASTDPKFKQYEIHLSEDNQSFYLKGSDYYYEAGRLIGKVATIEDRNETYGGLKNLDPNTTYYIIVRVRTCYDTYADSEVLKVQTLAE